MSSPSSGNRRNLSAVSAGSSSQDPIQAGKRVKVDTEGNKSESSTDSDALEIAMLEAMEAGSVQEDPAEEDSNQEIPTRAEGDPEQAQQAGGQQSKEDANLPEYLRKYEPVYEYVFQPGEPDHDIYYASADFQADPCPGQKYSGLDNSNFTWQKIEEFSLRGEPGVYSDGKKKRRRARKQGDTGHHITGLNFERVSATEKYLQWREQILSRPDRRANKRKPRKITLEELEPCGQKGEGDKWALKVKGLDRMLKTLAPKSHITMVLCVTPNPYVAEGYYRAWYDAILEILHKHPENFVVQLSDTSILDCDVASFVATQVPAAKEYDDDEVRAIFGDNLAEKEVVEKRQELNQGAENTRDETCQRHEGHLEHCRRFVEEVQRIQNPSTPPTHYRPEQACEASVISISSG